MINIISFGISISIIVLCYIIGRENGSLARKIDSLEDEIMALVDTKIRILKQDNKDEDILLAYIQYLESNLNKNNIEFITFDVWSKGYNCGGYHD